MAEDKTLPAPAEKPQLTRISFDLPAASVAVLKAIQTDCYAQNLQEVMKKALKLLGKCLKAEKRGAKINITERDGKISEISLFLL